MRRVLSVYFAMILLAPIGCRNSDSTPGNATNSNAEGEVSRQRSDDPAEDLHLAVQADDWNRALQIAPQAMIASPDDPNVLTNAAIATAKSGRRVEAAQLLVDAAKASQFASDSRIDNAVRALLDVGHVYDAIDLLEHVVKDNPSAAKYRRMLVGFLGEVELTEAMDVHMSQLVRDRKFDLPLLLATTETNSRRFSQNSIDALLTKNPDDHRPRLGQAKSLLGSRDAEGAERILREILNHHPDFAPAHAMLGVALITQGKVDQVPGWYSKLPQDASEFSGYWVTVGDWAITTGQPADAVRAFAEATRRSPNDSGIWARLGGAIRTWKAKQEQHGDEVSDSDVFDLALITNAIDKRSTDLLELREQFAKFRISEYRSQKIAGEIARELLDLGRIWEAEAWLAVATQLPDEQSGELTDLREEAIRRLRLDRDWQSRQDHPELVFDLERFPLPRKLAGGEMRSVGLHSARESSQPSTAVPLPIRLVEESHQRNLKFYGEVGSGVKGPRVPIHQTLGCGGGVIDIDNDGRHDLVFAAAGGSPRGTDSEPGALFRNLGSSFSNVSSESDFGDGGFGHGIVIGDYDDDGFQDVAVLNLGRNRLFRNNGDGTFGDATDRLAETGKGDWSTSGAIIDVDGDGYNDLVVVNYCDANQPLDEPCFDTNGQEINCYPLRYRAARDRFLRGEPTGHFTDVTDAWATQPSAGRGLGIVAGRLDGRTQGVYIVNDASNNHFYRWNSESESDATIDDLTEAGVASGLAVDAQSLDQGSMGIASGDLDNDGDLDLYVTGFNREYNIYYDQQAPGFWSDRTAAMGMISSTLGTVGFGTEAIDFDNDGVDELLVANGHIGDFGAGTSPYAQPLQLFRASPEGGFRLTNISKWDPYLASPHVGRALFTCDANQDGRTDVVVTHATEPVTLLVNKSDPKYQRIAFRLVDTRQTRDAVGAVLQFGIQAKGQTQRRVLFRLSGDGYLCSNQPELVAGTGSASVVHDVQVSWPDGDLQRIGDLETNAEYLIVRGETPFVLRRYEYAK